jgi:hypothetical protein
MNLALLMKANAKETKIILWFEAASYRRDLANKSVTTDKADTNLATFSALRSKILDSL